MDMYNNAMGRAFATDPRYSNQSPDKMADLALLLNRLQTSLMKLKRSNILVAAIVLAGLAFSYSLLHWYHFEIINVTGHELKDVHVVFADASRTRQSLGDGETYSFRPNPKHDGGISVSYIEDGNLVKHELGYVAPPISMKCKFEIVGKDVRGDCK